MKRVHRSLRQRVLRPPLLLGAAVSLVTVVATYFVLNRVASNVGELRATSLTRSIENAAQVTATAGELQRFVAALGAEQDVGLALVIAGNPARVVASSKRSLLSKPLSVLSREAQEAVATVQPRSSLRHAQDRLAVARVALPGLEFSERALSHGLVLVELGEPPLQAEIKNLAFGVLIAGVLVTLLWANQTALVLRRHVLGPVAALRQDVERERGESRGADSSSTGDELVDLHQSVLAAFRERREAFQQLTLAKEVAESGARARTEFLAMMSHEIRTPMNGVLGVLQLIKQTNLTGEQAELLEVIESSGESLLVILNDILDFTKIESGNLSVERTPFSPTFLVIGVQQLFAPAAAKKGITLEVRARDLPSTVLGDPTRLRQVLSNLVSNAVKFTNEGSVKVTVTRGAGEQLHFEVVDTGVGIPAEYLPKLFDKFSQADISTTRKFGGTGLGMAIANRLVQLMGGELKVTSSVGQGTCARFSAPCPATQLDARDRETLSAELHTLAKTCRLSVLVAEDHEINQLVITRLLEGMNTDVVLVKNGLEAVSAFEAGQFDVVLMDCQMPELDGYDATRQIRALEAKTGRSRTLIMALTANAFSENERLCAEAGMDGCLTKPLRVEQLRAALQRAQDCVSASPELRANSG